MRIDVPAGRTRIRMGLLGWLILGPFIFGGWLVWWAVKLLAFLAIAFSRAAAALISAAVTAIRNR